jgi:hypothetical protein
MTFAHYFVTKLEQAIMCFVACAEYMHVLRFKNVREVRLLHLLNLMGRNMRIREGRPLRLKLDTTRNTINKYIQKQYAV